MRKGKGKKKKNEKEWIDIEETEDEEEEEFKKNEKETSEEVDTATDGSEKKDSYDDRDLDITMGEYMRKNKEKSHVSEQVNPTHHSPKITTPPVTPPSTGTTPPPPNKTDDTQPEKETENLPTNEPNPPIEQPKEKTPPILEETTIISPNITSDSSVLQVPIDATKKTTTEENEPASKDSTSETSASALGASAPESTPVVERVDRNDPNATLNLVITELADKLREDIRKKFLNAASKKKDGGEASKAKVSMDIPKEAVPDATKVEPKEKGVEEEINEKVDPTEKDVAEVLKDLTEKVLEDTAEVSKATEKLSGANAPSAFAPEKTPEPEKSARTAALKTDATASKSGSKGGKKPPKPKPTPTRQSNRLKSGANPL